MSFEHVHRPQRYRYGPRGRSRGDGGPRSRGGGRPQGFFGADNSDIPGFDDFFTKIEQAVEDEIGESPYQVQGISIQLICGDNFVMLWG